MNDRSSIPLSNGQSILYDCSDENVAKVRDMLVKILGPEHIISNPEECYTHSITKWSPASQFQVPNLVVFPQSTSDVSTIMKICSQSKIPVVGYCGGTSMPGAIAATRRGICVDFKRMNRILATHPEDMDVVVQPALDWQELNAHLETHDFFFPPDPSPGARIGGMIAMNCSGTNAYRYGPMRHWVISMTVVLADGTVAVTRRRPRKSSAGYDLTNLMVGSEGTLGLVTEAVLKVTSLPKNLHVAVASFSTTHKAADAATALIRSGLPIEALELLDKHSMWAINTSGLSSRRWNESPTLFLKFAGLKTVVEAQLKIFRQAADNHHCEDLTISAQKGDIDISWGARKAVGPSLMAMKSHPSDLFLNADAAVPISMLADMMDETQRVMTDAGFPGSTLGHVGDGNYHTVIVCPESQRDKGEEILNWVQKRAIELDGTVTGEHGIGSKLRERLVDEVGPESVHMMRRIKLALDPGNILNPDKVFAMGDGD